MDFGAGSTTRAKTATFTLAVPAAKGRAQAVTLPCGGTFTAHRTPLALAAPPGHGLNLPAGAANFGPLRRAKVSDTAIDLRYRPAAALSWAVGGRPTT